MINDEQRQVPSSQTERVVLPISIRKAFSIVPVPVGSVKGGVSWRKKPCSDRSPAMPTRNSQEGVLRSAVIDRFRSVATAPVQERKFPIGPASAKKLGYDRAEVDALLAFGRDSGYLRLLDAC